jgi:hypothetical protein
MARCVWTLVDVDVIEHMSMNSSIDARRLLFFMCALDHAKFVLILTTLWEIWTAKRKTNHEDLFQIPISTFDFVRRFMHDPEEIKPVVLANNLLNKPVVLANNLQV